MSVQGFLVQENTLMTIYAKLGFSGMEAEASDQSRKESNRKLQFSSGRHQRKEINSVVPRRREMKVRRGI